MSITFGKYFRKTIVDVDVEATRTAYAKITQPGPEECKCTYCQNWVKIRECAYPKKVISLLESMGIKQGYEAEVWEVTESTNRHYYCGWYPFHGKIIKASKNGVEYDGMKVWVTSGLSMSFGDFPKEGVQELYFSTTTQWVLDEPPEPDTDSKLDNDS